MGVIAMLFCIPRNVPSAGTRDASSPNTRPLPGRRVFSFRTAWILSDLRNVQCAPRHPRAAAEVPVLLGGVGVGGDRRLALADGLAAAIAGVLLHGTPR
jgi:hypothetical protein